MADDSPGKVQALRAIFSEKNSPVMGMMPPPGAKIPGRPWRSLDVPQEPTALQEKKLNELRLANNKVLPDLEKSPVGDRQNRPASKPAVGPKPTRLAHHHHPLPHQQRPASAEPATSNSCAQRIVSEPPSSTAPQSKSRVFAETIATFMFASNKENEDVSVASTPPPLPPVPKPRISQLQENVLNFSNDPEPDSHHQCCSLISSDNYICRVRRKELPSREKLGAAPLKPTKPVHLRLPPSSCSSTSPQVPPPVLSQRHPPLQRPAYPCPPRPVTPPPLPPILAPVIKPASSSLREEIEELYEDTLLGENKRPVSLIPEFTEEEEQAELYHDATDSFNENSSFSDSSLKYKKPPPPIPSEYLQPNINGSNEELYQDTDGMTQEEFYEVMPCDEILEDSGSPLYSNNKREIEKMKKEEEKRIRREQKEKEKKEKELEKLRRKFGLTGEEIPIDDGLVKWDSRGGKGDLPVKKGETVLILRMEGNPSGRWLVKNEKGKIGYVELTNIEVDPLSVKSVMSIRRLSVISAGEEIYCEAKSEEEAIYEVTY